MWIFTAQSEKPVAEDAVLNWQINVTLITKRCFSEPIYPYIGLEKHRFLTREAPFLDSRRTASPTEKDRFVSTGYSDWSDIP